MVCRGARRHGLRRRTAKTCRIKSRFGTRPEPPLSRWSRSPPMPASVTRPITPRLANIRTGTLHCGIRTVSSPAGADRGTDLDVQRVPQRPAMNQRTAKVGRLGVVSGQAGELPYSIEMWDGAGKALERVLARALNAQLAREIFQAA